MRAVAAVPALGLLAGAAFGLLAAPSIFIGYGGLIGCAAVAVWAWWAERPIAFALFIVATFVAGGALLSADAWQRAWRPSLRLVFEDLARRERAQAGQEGRRLPEDDEALAWVTGVLRSDAAPTPSGVSLSLEVDSVRGAGVSSPATEQAVTGAVIATVVGALTAEHVTYSYEPQRTQSSRRIQSSRADRRSD